MQGLDVSAHEESVTADYADENGFVLYPQISQIYTDFLGTLNNQLSTINTLGITSLPRACQEAWRYRNLRNLRDER